MTNSKRSRKSLSPEFIKALKDTGATMDLILAAEGISPSRVRMKIFILGLKALAKDLKEVSPFKKHTKRPSP